MIKRMAWTESEVTLLAREWPKGGLRACRKHLPGRSDTSIAAKASMMKLKVGGRQHPRPINWTPFLDKQIKLAYADPTTGAVKSAAKRIGVSYGAIRMRARTLGCIYRYYNVPWREEENEIVQDSLEKGLTYTRRKLKKAGYNRSEAAISSQRNRLGLTSDYDPDIMNANQLAKLCGVDGKTVVAWIKGGWLEGKRGEAINTPGPKKDYLWVIKSRDFRTFIRDYPLVIDLRKVDQPWFLDIVLGGPRRYEEAGNSENRLPK